MSLRDDLLAQAELMQHVDGGKSDYPVKAVPVSKLLSMLDDSVEYQYCIMHWAYPDEPHRGPYDTLEEAQQWLNEALEDGFATHVFRIEKRYVGKWMKHEG